MYKFEGNDGQFGFGEDADEAVLDAGYTNFDTQPSEDEQFLDVFVDGIVVGTVWQQTTTKEQRP